MNRFGCTSVMATGIVSLDLHAIGWSLVSDVLFGIAAVLWAALALSGAVLAEVAGVPATSVVATRAVALGWQVVGWVLLAVAAVLLIRHLQHLLPPRPARGSDLVAVVALQSLAVLSGTLGAHWVIAPVVAAGLALYAWTMLRFDLHEITRGAGDQWIAGGALAISGEACARLSLHTPSLVLWWVALAWLPVLIGGELARPRLGDPVRRWSTVFPLGMYAALTLAVGEPGGKVAALCALAAWGLVVGINLVVRRSSIRAADG